MSLAKFSNRALSKGEMSKVHGGQLDACSVCSACIASNGPACTAAGNTGGAWDTCVITLRTECENQSYCQTCNA